MPIRTTFILCLSADGTKMEAFDGSCMLRRVSLYANRDIIACVSQWMKHRQTSFTGLHTCASHYTTKEAYVLLKHAQNSILGGEEASRECPNCHSKRNWKDGIRKTVNIGIVQRYICRDCGYRFSESSVLSRYVSYNGRCQVGAVLMEAKNLAEVEPHKSGLAGATKTDIETTRGLIAQYAYWLEKEGYTNPVYVKLVKRLVRIGANLLDPESIKQTIARQHWKNGTKMLAVYAYNAMAKMLKITWSPPTYIQEEILPFIPYETELDQLIAGCRSRRMATFLQTLKETFADPGEALKLRWIDISGNVISINAPVKGHRPRQLTVSNKLLTMLNALQRTSERIFPTSYDNIVSCFIRVRRRVAKLLENPRINAISFNTFRHWGATMTFHYSNNILLVQKLLGHKSITNTMKYTQLVHFEDDKFHVATATTVEEAKELLATGFNYITEKNGIMLFRKPKMLQV